MSLFFIMLLWTWGITPLWVNIVGTVWLSFRMFIKFLNFISSDDK